MAGLRYSTPIVIPQQSEVDDKKTALELNYILNALRTIALQIDRTTGALSPTPDTWPTINPISSILGNNTNKFYAICNSAIAYGAFVNFYNLDTTHVQARPASASAFGKAAGGFCVNPTGYNAGDWGEFVVGPGVNYGLAGMTPGNWYWLDAVTTTGQITGSNPTTAGTIQQICGLALTDTKLLVGSLNNWKLN